ncbi:large subunit ribosomal protein L13Ae [Nematocida homosporus]|uniref:large subunit ribosomal protein L13Ae n=1 Tax=Nematocida homosporus TaxID=1912981 RepID=UPI0022203A16|nr:large subunit ribosomal protein L13Ae [Nematocida homosporus]KAI5187053.1 large subunit ribosomal protein L13Ae [Nematocida homosporus]
MATTGRRLIIDGKDHIVGRLAAFVAKSLREGYEVIVLRAEGLIFSSPIDRMIKIYKDKQRKRCLVNPKKGPFHFKEPSKCFRRVTRGMLNYKRTMGLEAFQRLKVYDGIPLAFENVEKVVCSHALAETQLNPVTKRCTLGEICTRMGWNNGEILQKFEEQRLARAKVVAKEESQKQKKKQEVLNSESFQQELNDVIAKIE